LWRCNCGPFRSAIGAFYFVERKLFITVGAFKRHVEVPLS
jgi:hypothetical protein